MSSAHDEGHGFGPVIWVTLACIVGAMVLVALFLPKETTTLFLNLNEKFNSFWESPLYLTARLVAGILVVGLGALATWLFFRLLEIEKQHEEHVYHHAHAEDAHAPHGDAHTPPPPAPHAQAEEETYYEDPLHPLPPQPVMHHIEPHDPGFSGINDARTKTAPPPQSVLQSTPMPSRLPGESGVRGSNVGEEHPGHFQWQSVLRLATSQNPSDWKLAIIEADVILDMMTYMQGFQGDTLGERLKNADPGFFKNLDFAKKAHWTRNQIAHNPDMEFTPRDINQAIRMYEAVFNEFKYI